MDLHCDLDLENNNLIFTQNTPAYDKAPSKICTSVDVVKTLIRDYMSPHYDPEFQHSKPIFLHDTLAHDDASPYQVWLQMVQQLRRYCPDEHSLKF